MVVDRALTQGKVWAFYPTCDGKQNTIRLHVDPCAPQAKETVSSPRAESPALGTVPGAREAAGA